jgi:hypothetical protein
MNAVVVAAVVVARPQGLDLGFQIAREVVVLAEMKSGNGPLHPA